MSASGDRSGVADDPADDRAAMPPEEDLPNGDATRAGARTVPGGSPDPMVDAGRSSRPSTCPYLRLAGPDGVLLGPRDVVADAHVCLAVGEPAALSDRQQALVCLTYAHDHCPRHLRAILAVPVPEPVVPPSRRPHPATLVAIAFLVFSTVVAVAFVAANGGIAIPVASAGPSPSATTLGGASPTPTAQPTASSLTTPSPSPSPNTSLPPSPSPSPPPSVAPSVTPRPTPTPRPTSNRYKLLAPCPGKPDCYIYTVRSGDNVFSIARYFGVALDTVYDLNPQLRRTGLRAGQELILPPPTR